MVEISGFAQPRFSAVKDAFAANFDDGQELGARFTVVQDSEVVVDLWAGFADRAKTRAFDQATLVPIFSTTKAVAAVMIARLVDQGRLAYDQPVADVWPEFAQAGKAAITVEQVMSHQDGLVGFPDEMDPELWFDWDAICAKLAAMAPMWPPGTASGYHPSTYGYTAGEIFRRVDGRTMGTALREDLAEPLGLDIWIGLPDSEHDRVADLKRPTGLPNFGPITEPRRTAFMLPWSAPLGRGEPHWRRAEIPSANGHATAGSLAKLMGALADDGWLEGELILSQAVIAEAARERIRGADLVLPYEMSWGAGFMRNAPVKVWGPSEESFGHSGWGGSCAFADPAAKLGVAYVMNRQTQDLLGDARPRRLAEALYASF